MRETIAFHIAALHRDFLACTSAELKKLGLSFGQMPYILYIGKHPGCAQAELTRALHLDWGYSQRSVTKLVETGFIRKEHDKESSCNCLELTDSGRSAFDVCHSVFQAWDRAKTERLTEEEKNTLIFLLSKLMPERKESC